MAVSRNGVDNSKIQEAIAAKLAQAPVDADGQKLSEAAIKAEFARAFMKKGLSRDEIDWLVYGLDRS